MADKPSPASLSELAAAQRTVFIATNLGTHLVVPFSDLDTVFDLKGKLERQHLLCFAEIGKIVVLALKVRRKKSFYHVPDIVFVKNAFDGVGKSYFLCADVSRIEEHNEHQLCHTPVSENLLTYTGNTGNNSADGLALSLYGSLDQGVSDPNKRSEVPQNYVECKNDTSKHVILEKIVVLENGTSKCDIVEHCNMSVEETLQSNHTATKKRKLDEVGAACLEENIDSYRETSKPGTFSQNSYGEKDKSEHAVINVLTAKPKDDENLSANGLKSRKKKKRNSSQNKLDEAVTPVATSAKDVLGESSLVITANQKNLTGEPETAIVLPGQIVDAECGISSKEKRFESIQEVRNYVPSTIDVDVTEANAGKVGPKSDASEKEATRGGKKMRNSKDTSVGDTEGDSLVFKRPHNLQRDVSEVNAGKVGPKSDAPEKEATRGAKKMRNSKDTCVGDIEGGSLVFKQPHNLQRDVRVSGKENFDTADAETVEEERALPQSKDSRMQLKKCESPDQDKTEVNSTNVGVTENGTIAPRKFSERRKSERTKDLDSETGRSATEGVEDVNHDISREHHEAVSVKHPSITDEEENIYSGLKEKKVSKVSVESTFTTRDADEITGNVMENKQQPSKHQDSEENVEKQSRRKSKKKRKSPAENLIDLQAQHQVVTVQDSVPPSDNNNKKEAVTLSRSATEDVKGSEPETSHENHEAVSSKHPSNEEENNNSETQGKDVLKASAEGTFMTRETDEITGNEMENKQQTSKHQDDEENVERQSRKKSKKKRKSPAENFLDLQAQDQVVTGQNSVPPSDNNYKKGAVRMSGSATEDVKGSNPETSHENHEAVSGKHPSNEEEKNNSETQGKDVLKASAEGTFMTRETDEITGNVMENKQQTSKHQDNEENVERQSRKKSKKKRKSPAENFLDLQAQDQVVTGQNSVPPSDNNYKKGAVRMSGSATEDVKGSNPETSHENHEAVCGKHPSNEEENNNSETQGKDVLKASAEGTFPTRKTSEVTGNEVGNVLVASKHQGNEVNMEKQMRKRSKKKRKSPAENLLDLQAEDEDVTDKNSVLPSDNNKMEAVRISRSATEDVKGSEPEISHESHEAVSGKHPRNKETNNSETQGKDVLKASAEGTFSSRKTDEITGNEVENLQHARKHQGNEENVEKKSRKKSKKKQKSPAKNLPDMEAQDQDVTGQNSVPPSDNKKEAVASPSLQKKDQLEKPAVSNQLNESKLETQNLGDENDPLPQPNSEVNKSAKQSRALDNNHKGRPVAANKQGNSSTIHLQGSSSKEKSDESMCQPEKKLPKASEGGAKASVSNTSAKSIRAETIRQTAVSVSRTDIRSEKIIEAGSVSTPSFKGSKNTLGGKDIMGNKRSSGVEGSRVANRILFGKANGEVVASSEDKKKLVATPGAIFNDDSSGSSEDDGGVSDSDSSTKTPSDHSLSSEYSDGESNASIVNSSEKGSFTPDRTKGQRKNIIKSCSSIAKDLSFDKILRSSSRFKKAHLTASQLQLEDEESQPVEFVPDSLADT